MKNKKRILSLFLVLLLAISAVVPAIAAAGKSWREDGTDEFEAIRGTDGTIKMEGSGTWYPYRYIMFKDKFAVDGFSVKIDTKIGWNSAINDAWSYIALTIGENDGVHATAGVGSFEDMTDGIFFKFIRTASNVNIVILARQNGIDIPYYNEWTDKKFTETDIKDLTFKFEKKDGIWNIYINNEIINFQSGNKMDLSFIDSLYADGKAYFHTGIICNATDSGSITLKEINGKAATELTAEGVAVDSSTIASSAVSSSKTTSSQSASSTVDKGGCGNKAK